MLEVYYRIDISKQLSLNISFIGGCCIIVNVAKMCVKQFLILTLGDKKLMFFKIDTFECASSRMHTDHVRAIERKLSWRPDEKQRQCVRGHNSRALKRKKYLAITVFFKRRCHHCPPFPVKTGNYRRTQGGVESFI